MADDQAMDAPEQDLNQLVDDKLETNNDDDDDYKMYVYWC